jgi:hypothetical protein
MRMRLGQRWIKVEYQPGVCLYVERNAYDDLRELTKSGALNVRTPLCTADLRGFPGDTTGNRDEDKLWEVERSSRPPTPSRLRIRPPLVRMVGKRMDVQSPSYGS